MISLVKSGKSYREIGEILWMSPQTIRTAKKNILGSFGNYKSYKKFYSGPTQWSGKVEIPKSFLEKLFGDIDIWDIIKNPPRPPGIGFRNSIKEFKNN